MQAEIMLQDKPAVVQRRPRSCRVEGVCDRKQMSVIVIPVNVRLGASIRMKTRAVKQLNS